MAPRIGGHMFYIGLYMEQHEKIFLSETTRPRALVFGMYCRIFLTLKFKGSDLC